VALGNRETHQVRRWPQAISGLMRLRRGFEVETEQLGRNTRIKEVP
jgi:hypothetical protein